MALLDFDALSLFFHHYLATELSHLDSSPSPHSSLMDSTLPIVAGPQLHGPKTPTHRFAKTVGATDITPHSIGSSARLRMDGDLPTAPKYQCLDFDPYLLQDIERHKVFVDIEDFMHSVLLIPLDWRDTYAPIIKSVRDNADFNRSLTRYLVLCDRIDINEEHLYDDHMEMNNYALSAIDDADPDGISLRFILNWNKTMSGGLFTAGGGLKPDLLLLLAKFLAARYQKNQSISTNYRFNGLAWAQVIMAWEMKHLDTTLDDGRSGKRIKDRKGNDPTDAHRRREFVRYRYRRAKIPVRPRKRKSEDETSTDTKRQKVQSAPVEETLVSVGSMGLTPVAEAEDSVLSKTKLTENVKATMLQVVRYLFEKFSASALRSHVTAGLIDRDRLQLFHANHSVLLISRAICLKESDDLDMFIAILIGLHKMTLRQLGVMDIIDQHREFLSNSGFYGERVGEGVTLNHKKMHDGNTMTLRQKVPGKKPIVINLDGILNREPSIIGRSTSTLYGTSDEWPGVNLVIKISFPSVGRVSEETFLNAATEKAKEFAKDGERYWVLDHLPQLLYAETAVLDEVEKNVKELCTTHEYVGGEKSSYEERRRRVLVYEMLNPLETLTTAKDFAQVFVDILTTHKWLYDHPKILHRDISMDNIMYRIGPDGTIYGVLNDFDLSSFRDAIGASTSVQRTGTPPFMAMDVLKNLQYHYYRHDLESIFYVMLVIASRHELQKPERTITSPPFLPRHLVLRTSGQLPLAEWFDFKSTYAALANHKAAFLKEEQMPLTRSFECFRPWLTEMLDALNAGLSDQYAHKTNVTQYEKAKRAQPPPAEEEEDIAFPDEAQVRVSATQPTIPPPPSFDDRTLGNRVTFKIFVKPAALVIRGLGSKSRYRYTGPEFVAGD